MNRVCIALLFFLLSLAAIPAHADTLDMIQVNVKLTPAGGTMSFILQTPGDVCPCIPPQTYYTSFSGVDVLSLTCANASCTRYNTDITLSGFSTFAPSSGPVFYKGKSYSDLFLTGTLDFVATKFSVSVTGTMKACTDATCNNVLFDVDVNAKGTPQIVATNNGGTLTLVSARDITPEPSTFLLFGTGFGLLAAFRNKFSRPKAG